MKKLVGFHGEVVPIQIERIPSHAKQIKLTSNYVVVGESEISGNDHRVCVKNKQVEFYERDGILYMKNLQPVEIGCVIEERHDTCIIPKGIWEFKKALEYDPINEILEEAKD